MYVNAYEEQAAHGDLYTGKRLAEGLQYVAYLCPLCHRFGTVHTQGNDISCDSTRYRLVATRKVSVLKYYALWRALSGREYK